MMKNNMKRVIKIFFLQFLSIMALLSGCYNDDEDIITGWYKGDLHAHSTYSDGDSSVNDVIKKAESLDLNFFVITDHDSKMGGEPKHWLDPAYTSDKMILFYGLEWSTSKGHANVWSPIPFTYDELWQANRNNDADAAIAAAHKQKALFSINHPTTIFSSSWLYGYEFDMDSIEIWNSMYILPRSNIWTTHVIWDNLLKKGRRIPAVGGSDTHYHKNWISLLYCIGNPTTWVYAEKFTAESILAGIKAGHTTISYSPYGERIVLMADADGDEIFETKMGDNIISQGKKITFKAKIGNIQQAGENSEKQIIELNQSEVDSLAQGRGVDELNLQYGSDTYIIGCFKNGYLYRVWLLIGGADTVKFKDTPKIGTYSYYRVELLGNFGNQFLDLLLYGYVISLSNPIYVNYSN